MPGAASELQKVVIFGVLGTKVKSESFKRGRVGISTSRKIN